MTAVPYALARAKVLLEALKPADADVEFCGRITDVMMALALGPFKFSIDHDVSCEKKDDPKTGACPIFYNWRVGRTVGLETDDPARAAAWAIEALFKGYSVTRIKGSIHFQAYSLQRERRFVEYRARPKSEHDDEIPF